jgi:hypothetical protein
VRCSTALLSEERLLTSIYELHAFFQFISFLLHVSSREKEEEEEEEEAEERK